MSVAHDGRSADEIEARLRGTPLVLMFDVDGTLAPIASYPSLAVVPSETRRVIAALAARRGVSVALVSGRAAADARRMVSVGRAWTVGNHGAEVMSPDGDSFVDPQVAAWAPAVAQAAHTLAPMIAPLAKVILENKVWTLSVHHRMADPVIVPRLRAMVEHVAAEAGLRVTTGKMIFEVRPPVRVDKGSAVFRLAQDLGALEPAASLLFAGDDESDEDAFRLLRARAPNAVTIRVGREGDSAAEYSLDSPLELRGLLERLAGAEGR